MPSTQGIVKAALLAGGAASNSVVSLFTRVSNYEAGIVNTLGNSTNANDQRRVETAQNNIEGFSYVIYLFLTATFFFSVIYSILKNLNTENSLKETHNKNNVLRNQVRVLKRTLPIAERQQQNYDLPPALTAQDVQVKKFFNAQTNAVFLAIASLLATADNFTLTETPWLSFLPVLASFTYAISHILTARNIHTVSNRLADEHTSLENVLQHISTYVAQTGSSLTTDQALQELAQLRQATQQNAVALTQAHNDLQQVRGQLLVANQLGDQRQQQIEQKDREIGEKSEAIGTLKAEVGEKDKQIDLLKNTNNTLQQEVISKLKEVASTTQTQLQQIKGEQQEGKRQVETLTKFFPLETIDYDKIGKIVANQQAPEKRHTPS